MEMANEVLVELQLKQQEIIQLLRNQIKELYSLSGSNNIRIRQLESEVEHLKQLNTPPPLLN